MRGNAQQGGSADFGELLKHMRRMHARLETMEKGQKDMAEQRWEAMQKAKGAAGTEDRRRWQRSKRR
jgi:hypothetical protein